MQNSGDGIRRKIQGVTEARSGYVNVQSLTGFSVWRLENETQAFNRYDFDMDTNRAPWIPMANWNRIILANFPGCTEFSIKTMANSAGYSDWRSFDHAVTLAGSAYHFLKYGLIWTTAANSFAVGPAHLKTVMAERRREGQGRGFLLAAGLHLKK